MKKEQKEINKNLKFLAKTSLIVLIGLILSKLLTYFYRILIARYFGPEEYGQFSLAIIVLGLFVAISTLGLTDGLLRYISLYRGKREQNKINYLINFCATLLLISGIISCLIMFFSASFISKEIFHNESLILYIKVFSFLVPMSIFMNVFITIIRAYEEINIYSFIQNILQNLVKLIFLLIFIFFGFKGGAVIFSYFLGIFSMLAVSYFFCRYKLSEIFVKYQVSNKIKKKINKEVLSYSWPIVFFGLTISILYWTDSFLLGYFKSVTEVGIYNAALPIVTLLSMAPEIFGQLFIPLIAKEYAKKNLSMIKELSKQIVKWIFIINLPLFLIILIFPGVAINLLFGANYLAAENALMLLSVGGIFVSLTTISASLLFIKGKSKLVLINILGVAIINIILDIILIPKYGLEGAAFATMFSNILFGTAALIETKIYFGFIPLRKKMASIFIASFVPLVLILFIKEILVINLLSLILIGLLFVLVYLMIIYAINGFDENDVLIIKSIKKKVFVYSPNTVV